MHNVGYAHVAQPSLLVKIDRATFPPEGRHPIRVTVSSRKMSTKIHTILYAGNHLASSSKESDQRGCEILYLGTF